MSIATEITRLLGAKADIKAAIEERGVTVPSADKLDVYDEHIRKIGIRPFMNPARPSFLQAGATIAVVALSSKVTDSTVIPAAQDLFGTNGWGLEVDMTYYANPTSDYQAIANRLAGALQDGNVDAVICARGGYGGIHILDLIPEGVVVSHPKWFIGYSDVTAYHCYYVNKGVMSVHGPMCSSITAHQSDGGSLEKLRAFLFGESGSTVHTFDDGNGNNIVGKVTGRLVGGNVSTFMPYLPDGEHSPFRFDNDYIVFAEDNGTNYARNIYRYFKEIYYTLGDRLKALLIGDYSVTADNTQGGTIYSIVKECCPGIPVAFTSKIGHADVNFPVVEGSLATLDITTTSDATLTFLQTGVRAEYSLSNVTVSKAPKEIVSGESFVTLLEAVPGYELGTVKVTMGGVDITSTAYDADGGAVSIAAVTGDIKITASATALAIPAGYTPVKYLLCTGAERFDAGFKGSNTIDVNVLVQGTDITTLANYAIFGGRTSASSKRFDMTFGKSEDTYNVPLGTIFWGKYNGSSQYNNPASMTGKVRIVTSNDTASIYNDGTFVASFNRNTGSAYTTAYNVYIGACNNKGTALNPFTGRLYRLTFGTVADFVPVVRDSDGKAGMYDIIRDAFYPSGTSTDFGYGND